MRILDIVLARLIVKGKVVLETPNLDMEALEKAVRSEAEQKLRTIESIVYEEELSEAARLVRIQMCLEE